MADTGLGGEVGGVGDFVEREELFEEGGFSDVSIDYFDTDIGKCFGAGSLEEGIVVVVEVIEANDEVPSRLQIAGEMKADEASGSSDQNSFH